MRRTVLGGWGLALAVLLLSCGGQSSPPFMLRMRGSTSVYPLAVALSQGYITNHSAAMFDIMESDSGDGVLQVGTGTADIGMASRPLTATELMTYSGLVPVEIARDAISVIVHPSNPIRTLTMSQLADIFAGRTTDWSTLGQPAGPIHVFVRETGSGTRDFFSGLVLGTTPFVASATVGTGTDGERLAVANDPAAIGFISLGSVDATVLGLSIDAGNGPIAATTATVRSQSYPITRPLLLIKPAMPTSAATEFVDYCLTPAAQTIVTMSGFVSDT